MLFNFRFPLTLAFCVGYFDVTFVQGHVCTATLQSGTVVGKLADTLNPDKKVCAFTSIPYASPPVGDLRFQPPQPAKAWKTTLNATSFPNQCPQRDRPPEGIQMSEDCLYLNVYQPKTKSARPLPVMIWFHGGAFITGSSLDYDPIMMQSRGDVVMVIVHYRLGNLGFLSTGDEVVPGNNGLKDQAFSIRWVNENIQAFRGDKRKVTIFGESAGAASVIYQMISPLNKGLIHGIIAQSGTALSPWAIDKNPKESAKLMASLVGCPSDVSSAKMVACLKNISWEMIIEAQNFLIDDSYSHIKWPFATMDPVVEPNLPGAFIAQDPEILLRTGDIPDIPVIIGTNKHDGSFVLAVLYAYIYGPQKLDTNAEYMKDKMVPELLKFFGVNEEDTSARMKASTAELAYLNGVNRSSWDESMPGLVDLSSVYGFKSPVQNTAEILARRNRTVYLYSFEHHSNNTLSPPNPQVPVETGIGHGDDLIYLFPFPYSFGPQDRSFSDIFCDLWLNFGKYGNPTPSVDDTRFEQWIPYNVIDEPFLKLNGTPTMQYELRNTWRPNGFEWD